ncbi:MAG: polysaccharide biosynthesis tyrosine autokinase [Deltaproteobacteria bacterium]
MNDGMIKNYYATLNIELGASRGEIEQAYKQAAGQLEGDEAGLYSLYTSEEKRSLLNELTEAYETLSDGARKKAYDAALKSVAVGSNAAQLYEGGKDNTFADASVIDDAEMSAPQYGTFRFRHALAVMGSTDPMVSEQYRILYTKLEKIALRDSVKVFAVTSAVKGEGKSQTALNLSYLIAKELKKKTILVECDMRKPSTVIRFMDAPVKYGLSDVLKDGLDPLSVAMKLHDLNLYVLPAGARSDTTTGLLGSSTMKRLINTLKTEFDYVIVDSPPVLPLVDMNIISGFVDALLMVVRAGKTPKDIVVKAVHSMPAEKIAGIILNGAETKLGKYYY